MIKENSPIALTVNSRILELQQQIENLQVFSQASIQDESVTALFPELLFTESIALSQTGFNNPNDNSLQVTAVAGLFKQQIKVTAVFVADQDKKLTMTMNTFEDMSMSLQQVYKDGLIPGVETPENIPAVPMSALSFVFDSSSASFNLKGAGDKWTFLGYQQLYADQPVLSLAISDDAVSCTAKTTLKSDTADVDIPVVITLPVNIAGWSLALESPIPLTKGVAILDALTGIQISKLVPEQFTTILEEVQLAGFYISFDPVTGKISMLQFQVTTTSDWVIITDKLKLDAGITLTVSGTRLNPGEELSFTGTINASATVNYSNPDSAVQAAAAIPLPLTGSDWSITLANDKSPLGFGKLLAIVPGVTSFLPGNIIEKLNEIVLDYLTIRFKFDQGFSFTNVAFSIHSANEWQLPLLEQAIYLDKNFKVALDIPFPYDATQTSGEISGVIQIDDGNVSIPVSLTKTPDDENWNLHVTSEQIPLPSISSLAAFMGGNVLSDGAPSGLMNIGEFAIYELTLDWQFGAISKLLQFSFIIASTEQSPPWKLVPGYFELSDMFVSLKIDNRSVSEKDISGAIGATVTWILNPANNSKLELAMSATKASSSTPWKFAGSLEEDLILKDLLLALKTPAAVVNILPDLKVTKFDLAIEPTSGSFSIAMAIAPVDTWTIATIGTMDLQLGSIGFSVEKYDSYLDMSANGSFNFGTAAKQATISVSAGYKDKNWTFSGALDNTGNDPLTINEVMEKYIPGITLGSIPQVKITTIDATVVKGTTETEQAFNTVDFTLSGGLSIRELLQINANVHLLYDSRKITSPYEGTRVEGIVQFGGINFDAIAIYTNGQFSDYTFRLTFKDIVAEAQIVDTTETLQLTFTLGRNDPDKPLSLGDFIATMLEAATGDVVNIPSPWNFINNIPINSLGLVFTLDKKTNQKTVGLTWRPDINLVFITIKELTIQYAPAADNNNGPVEFKITEGTFLGMPIDKMPNNQRPDWDLRDPGKAPAVPGFGESTFKLQFLGIGNQVAIKTAIPPTSVAQAITNLTNAFKADGSGTLPPSLSFDKNYGILLGTKFLLVEYIQLNAVFYDPAMYGVSIGVSGGTFEGLYFEVLYKKVSENVGMYQIDLVLPEFVRQQQFGAVAVTMPSLTLSIYTNGDFVIDMGFPKNGDFSRSFGLEVSIFTGAGGFYFGKLSNDTATSLPKADGQFNPVIIFGIGIRAGVGKSIDKGFLKAELSLTLQVILEGILAWYKANPPAVQGNEVLYYKLQAQAALVGRIYGEIDFAIISASIEVMVRIAARLVLEAYRESKLTFTAEVYAAVKLRINLGLFSISISCSFRTTISDTYTIGSTTTAPWDKTQLIDKSRYFTPLDADMAVIIPKMLWTAPMDYSSEALELLFIPQLSLKYSATAVNNKQAVAVALLYITNNQETGDSTNFTILSRAYIAWVFNAYFTNKPEHAAKILEQEVTIDDVNMIFAYFNQPAFTNGDKVAFSMDDFYNYFFPQGFTTVTISTSVAGATQDLNTSAAEVAFFPMIPILQMNVAGKQPVNFNEGPVSSEYLQMVKAYFADMQVQFRASATNESVTDTVQLTMAEFLFTDYFMMMAKSALQDIINGFKQTTLTVQQGDSLDKIAARYKTYGVSNAELAFSNRHHPLNVGAKLTVPGFRYCLKDGEKLSDFADTLPFIGNLAPGADGIITVPFFEVNISADEQHTLASLANKYNADIHALIAHNTDQPDIFAQGATLLHAFVSTKTVQQILDELQAGKQSKLSNIGAIASRFHLHGLRIPASLEDKSRIGLYEATKQQYDLEGTILNQTVSLKVNPVIPYPFTWLRSGDTGEVSFLYNQKMADAVTAMISSQWTPDITFATQENTPRYRLHPRTFALANSYSWKDPNLQKLKTTTGDSFIWRFPEQLQHYLATYNTIPYQLLIQSVSTDFTLEDEKVVKPIFWSTTINVSIRQVPSVTAAGNYADNVYVVEGCGEADGQLLELLIPTKGAFIQNLDILFADNTAKDNNGEPVNGLVSNGLKQYSTFLLQTNFSTLSNPGTLIHNMSAAAPNLNGMDAITFLTYLWECAIVRSGGYYLQYKTSGGGGLPNYLFDEEGKGSITLQISYNFSPDPATGGYILPSYVNSVVIDTKVDVQHDSLYAGIVLTNAQENSYNPILQTMQATILPGTGMFRGQRINPDQQVSATIGESADRQLSELFQLMEYRLEAIADNYQQSNYALPAGPLENNEGVKNSLNNQPAALTADNWNYSAIVPIYPFALVPGNSGKQEDPYAANGKSATVQFNFLDVFGNSLTTDDSSKMTQQITPGYTDAIIGIDQWVNVSRKFSIGPDNTGKPGLTISLVFDTLRYQESKDPVAQAKKDIAQFRQIAWQLAQPGIKTIVQCSIGTLASPVTELLIQLQSFINNIITFLHSVKSAVSSNEDSVTCDLIYGIDTGKLNQDLIFQLSVAITIERTLFIDPQFASAPDITKAATAFSPDLYDGKPDNETALSIFARKLEAALPFMKVAVGQTNNSRPSDKATPGDSGRGKEIWLVRFATVTEPGISFNVDATPVYYGIAPLSTSLISRPNNNFNRPVPVKNYVSGSFIGNAAVESKSYTGIDMELLARTFISAVDNFLSAEMATLAWATQQTGNSQYLARPFQAIEQAKCDIAKAIATQQVTNILDGTDNTAIAAAQQAIEQQLLIALGSMYTCDALVQTQVNIEQGFNNHAANLYGNLIKTGSDIPKNNYTLSPVRIGLKQGNTALTSVFSVRQEHATPGTNQSVDLIDEFQAGLYFNITAIEHQFGTPIEGYTPSSWLTFANPISRGDVNTPLINADIPLPLKAYPTAPSLVTQTGTGAEDAPEGQDDKQKLQAALKWNYGFTYNYVIARQDLVYLDIKLNMLDQQGYAQDEMPIDLFEALMQFNISYEAVLNDLNAQNENSLIALQSLAWLIKQVATAWPEWFKSSQDKQLKISEKAFNYVISEYADENNGNLLIRIQSTGDIPATVIPVVEIEGFTSRILSSLSGSTIYYFEQVTDGVGTPLPYADRRKFSERTVVIKDNNVLIHENAWAGVAIHRNEILTNKPTNKVFRYITPYIRFANFCYPALSSETEINIGAFTPGASKDKKVKLDLLLDNLFAAMFEADPQRSLMLQLQAGYGYTLQTGEDVPLPLGPVLPIVLSMPVSTSGKTIDAVVIPFTTVILDWFSNNLVTAVETNGKIHLIVSLYAATGAGTHHPVLILSGLYLDTNIIDFS